MTGHRNSATILDGYCKHLGLTSRMRGQLITECGHQNRRWRAAFAAGSSLSWIYLRLLIHTCTRCQQRESCVFNVVDGLTRFTIEPVIADHSVCRGCRACRQSRVANDGLVVGVIMVGIRVNRALFPQVAKSAVAQTLKMAGGKISTQLIHSDLQDQTWW